MTTLGQAWLERLADTAAGTGIVRDDALHLFLTTALSGSRTAPFLLGTYVKPRRHVARRVWIDDVLDWALRDLVPALIADTPHGALYDATERMSLVNVAEALRRDAVAAPGAFEAADRQESTPQERRYWAVDYVRQACGYAGDGDNALDDPQNCALRLAWAFEDAAACVAEPKVLMAMLMRDAFHLDWSEAPQ